MMTVPMDENSSAPSGRERAEVLFKKNVDLENGLRKSAQSKIPSDPNAWLQMRENYEAIILEDHDFSEKHEVEYRMWQLHYRRIEEFRAHINAAASAGPQGGKNLARPDRIKKIRSVFKSFLSEATGFYHELMQKIRAKYGLPLGYFSEGPESQIILTKDEKKSADMRKGQLSCHRCLIYLGDLARYKGLYGEGDSVNRDYAAASSYYIQSFSLWPSSGNPHHQLAILSSYSGDELVAIYRYFRSLAVDSPFSTARDNLIIAFEKNRQSYSQLPGKAKVTSGRALPARTAGRGRGRGDTRLLAKDMKAESSPAKERELNIPEVFKAFSTRFVRLNGILFTRTSLETFGEVFSLVVSDLHDLLSSGPDEELNFGSDTSENGLFIVRLMTILIFTAHNVNKESESQSYAEILQRTVLLQNAFTAAFEFAGHILKRCIQLQDGASSYLLPAVLVFIEWLACHPDIAAGSDVEEKQATARSFFWNQCVSLMNRLLLSGFVPIDSHEDETCFSDMSLYDDEETGNRFALWEDFELRGFTPLVPAHLILDFTRKHSFGGDGTNKEKKARVQRILAAARVLMNVVRVDQQGIYFDSNLKKFVIAAEPPAGDDDIFVSLTETSESDLVKQGSPTENASNIGLMQSKTQLHEERQEDEEEEEIVFKPTIAEKYPSSNALPTNVYEHVQPVQSYSRGDWPTYGAAISAPLHSVQMSTALNAAYTAAPNLSQQPSGHMPSTSSWLMDQQTSISDSLRSLSIVENGFHANVGFQGGLSFMHSAPVSHNASNVSSSQIKAAETVIPSKLDSVVPSGANLDGLAMKMSAAMPAAPRKNPVSRPLRHFGPPPGFNPLPLKQPDESNSIVNVHHPQIDDYSWLDGYQLPTSSEGMGHGNPMNQTAPQYPHITMGSNNTLSDAMTFPFPGKQVSTVQNQVVNENWQDFQLFDHLKPYSERQFPPENVPPVSLPEQYQANSLWSGRYFV